MTFTTLSDSLPPSRDAPVPDGSSHAPSAGDDRTASVAIDGNGTWKRPAVLAMVAAALLAMVLWAASGAAQWRGYPTEHAHGRLTTVVLGVAVQIILVCIARFAIAPPLPSRRVLWLALACWTVARLVTTSLVPLLADEAYHWAWAGRLALGYYDHPGMVAWLARLMAPGHGDATALVRLSCVVQGAVLVALTYALAKMTTGREDTARRSALLVMLMPVFAAGSLVLAPPVPFNVFWLMTVALLWWAHSTRRTVAWIAAGVALGGALDSYFISFLIPPIACIYLVAARSVRRTLARPGPWLALLVAGACFLPTLVWNAQHDWSTMRFNLTTRYEATRFRPDAVAAYAIQVALCASPVLAVGLVAHGAAALRRVRRDAADGALFLLCMGFGPLLVFLAISTGQKITGYYAAPGLIPLVVLFVEHARRRGAFDARRRARGLYKLATDTSLWLTMGIVAALLLPALVPAATARRISQRIEPETASKRTAEVYGWPALDRFLAAQGTRFGADTPVVIVASSYAQAALTMHYARNADYVYNLGEETSRYGRQSLYWHSLRSLPAGRDAIIIRTGLDARTPKFRTQVERLFDRVEPIEISSDADPILRDFALFRASGYRPPPPPAPADGAGK